MLFNIIKGQDLCIRVYSGVGKIILTRVKHLTIYLNYLSDVTKSCEHETLATPSVGVVINLLIIEDNSLLVCLVLVGMEQVSYGGPH